MRDRSSFIKTTKRFYMTKDQKREILFNKTAMKKKNKVTVTLMGHWNNDSGCMPIVEDQK